MLFFFHVGDAAEYFARINCATALSTIWLAEDEITPKPYLN
jgi:hypothetical protein